MLKWNVGSDLGSVNGIKLGAGMDKFQNRLDMSLNVFLGTAQSAENLGGFERGRRNGMRGSTAYDVRML